MTQKKTTEPTLDAPTSEGMMGAAEDQLATLMGSTWGSCDGVVTKTEELEPGWVVPEY